MDKGLLPWFGGIAVAIFGALGAWAANKTLGKAAFQNAITSGFAELHKQEEAARLSLQTQLTALRAEMAEERLVCQEKLDRMSGVVTGLKRAMRMAGMTVPAEDVLLQEAVNEQA